MKLFNRLFDFENNAETKSDSQQAVIVHFGNGIQNLDELHNFETKLAEIITANKLGIYDGHEIALDNSDGYLFMYGQNAENLFKGVKSYLESHDFMKGALVKLRFGPAKDGVSELEIYLY